MLDAFSRTRILYGTPAMEKLARSHVAVFGIGGVGGYVCEALARTGIGAFDLIDSDRVTLTNLNRQIIATLDTVGRFKTDVMAERIAQINPQARVTVRRTFFLPENAAEFPFDTYDYIVDAIDTVTSKLALIQEAKARGIPVISSMGAGNKFDPALFHIADIQQTRVDPLARVMRRELRKRGIEHLKVVYSEETPAQPLQDADMEAEAKEGRRAVPGSTAFVPSAAGLILASEVVRDLTSGLPRVL